jgi:hypothetical protein
MAQKRINFVVRVIALDGETSETLGHLQKMYSLEEIQNHHTPSDILGGDILYMIRVLSALVEEGQEDGPKKA